MAYLKPSEILEKYPYVKNVWKRPQLLGYLLLLKLVSGYKTARSCYLDENEVLQIYNYYIKSKNE